MYRELATLGEDGKDWVEGCGKGAGAEAAGGLEVPGVCVQFP